MKTIKIKDYYGVEQVVPVSDEVYEEWLELRREEDRQRKKIAYHHSGATLDDLETGIFRMSAHPEMRINNENSPLLHQESMQLLSKHGSS